MTTLASRARRLRRLLDLTRYEGQPAAKLCLIYSTSLGALAAAGINSFEAAGSPQLALACKHVFVTLTAYGLWLTVAHDNYTFLSHVENVIGTLPGLALLLLLRAYALGHYGPVNNFEILIIILFSAFGLRPLYGWLAGHAVTFHGTRVSAAIIREAEATQRRGTTRNRDTRLKP